MFPRWLKRKLVSQVDTAYSPVRYVTKKDDPGQICVLVTQWPLEVILFERR